MDWGLYRWELAMDVSPPMVVKVKVGRTEDDVIPMPTIRTRPCPPAPRRPRSSPDFHPRAIAQDDPNVPANKTIAAHPIPPRPLQLHQTPSTAHSNPHAPHRRKVRPHSRPNNSPRPRPQTTARRPSTAPSRHRLGRTRGSPPSDRADIQACQECRAEWITWEFVLAIGLGCQGRG